MQVHGGLGWVWTSLCLFYAARMAQHGVHTWLHWRTSAFGLCLPPAAAVTPAVSSQPNAPAAKAVLKLGP